MSSFSATPNGRMPCCVILVAYHASDYETVLRLLEEFKFQTGFNWQYAIVVDNRRVLKPGKLPNNLSVEVIQGTNTFWEFSGWDQGLRHAAKWPESGVIALLNDSFVRNWTVTRASHPYIQMMQAAAAAGFIAAWRDSFSILRPPYFSRRTNSRLAFLHTQHCVVMADSIESAIEVAQQHFNSGKALFTAAELAVLSRWERSQPGRWPVASMPDRRTRIFLEHHLFDTVPVRLMQWFPGSLMSSLRYSLLRRMHGERR